MAINFKLGKVQADKKALERYTKNILEILENGEEYFEDFSYEDIEYILRMSEILATQCRFTLEIADKNPENFDFYSKERIKKDNEIYQNNLPIYVKSYPKMLYIFMPFTFKRPLQNSYILGNYLAEILEKMKENNELNFNYDGQFSFVVVRKSLKFNRSSICDNDNFETSRIINTVFRALNKSDNATQVDFISNYEIAKDESECGLHIYLVPKADFRGLIQENIGTNFYENAKYQQKVVI